MAEGMRRRKGREGGRKGEVGKQGPPSQPGKKRVVTWAGPSFGPPGGWVPLSLTKAMGGNRVGNWARGAGEAPSNAMEGGRVERGRRRGGTKIPSVGKPQGPYLTLTLTFTVALEGEIHLRPPPPVVIVALVWLIYHLDGTHAKGPNGKEMRRGHLCGHA